jgi:hypothetical protein
MEAKVDICAEHLLEYWTNIEQYPQFGRTDYSCILATQYEDLIQPVLADTYLSDTSTQTLQENI